MVAMHLGILKAPFVPHNLISAKESPVPLPKFQMAPRLNVLWVQERNLDMYFLFFFLKSPNKPTPSRFPNMAPMERAAHLQALFYISLKFFIKISLNTDIFPFSQNP